MSPTLNDAASVAAWIAGRLEDEGIEHAITGALALAAHGVVRMTRDADLAVFVPPEQIDRLFDALERAGCLFERAHARTELARGWFIVRCGKIECDVFVASHPMQREALARRVRIALSEGERWFHSAEDLAVHKLVLFRPRDQSDLEQLFAAQGGRLDVAYIARWLSALLPDGGPRRDALDDLVRRFVRRA